MEQLNNKQARQHYGYDEPREFNCNFFPHKAGTYVIEVDGPIESASQFSTAVHILNNANEQDEVEFRISCCPGGSVDAMDVLLHAVAKTPAHVRATASGYVHSAGTHLLLAVDEFDLSEGFNSLIHAGTDGAYGTVSEYHAKSKFDLDFRTEQFKRTYEYFLTEQEIHDVLEGKDLWIDAAQWCERTLIRRAAYEAGVMAKIAEVQALEEAANKPAKKSLKLKSKSPVQPNQESVE